MTKKEHKRRYYLHHKEEILTKCKQKYFLDKEMILKRCKQYRVKNKEKIKKWMREYYLRNKKRLCLRAKEYQFKNRKKRTEYNRQYFLRNKQKRKEISARYRVKNKERLVFLRRQSYLRNREKILKYHKEYLLGKGKERRKIYIQNNYEKIKKRDQAKRHNLPLELIQQVYEENILRYKTLTCEYCLKPIKFGKDTLDHKIPVSRDGTNEYENLCIACKNCNSSKHDKNVEEFKEFLLKYKAFNCQRDG